MNKDRQGDDRALQLTGQRQALSSAQWAIWIDQALRPQVPLYVVSASMEGRGTIDPDCLKAAIEHVVGRHDALRLRIGTDHRGTVFQEIQARVDVHLDVSKTEPTAMAHELQRLAESPIDIERATLWDATLLRVDDEQWALVFRIHHIACDGAGLDIVMREIESAYNLLLDRGALDRASAPSPFESVADEDDYLTSARYARDRAFWLAQHAQLEPGLFTPGVDGESGSGTRSGQCVLRLPRAQVQALRELASAAGGTLSHLLLAVLAAYFARVNARASVVIGLAVHNRHGADQKMTVGMFASVLPLRIEVDPAATLSSLVRDIATGIRRCFRHQRYPMAQLNRQLRPECHGRDQIYDVSFSFESFGGESRMGAAQATLRSLDHGHEPLPLAVSARDLGPAQPFEVAFSHHLASCGVATAQALLARFQAALAAVVEGDVTLLRELPLLTPAERVRLLAHSSAESAPKNSNPRPLHLRIADHALADPDGLALVGDAVALSYRALNGLANRVAHRLLAMGVGPDDRVGLCVRRGPNLLVGLLGILKAGAAYLPLDPDYPPQRLAYMVDDALPAVVIGEAGSISITSTATVPVLLLDDAAVLDAQPDHDPVVSALGPGHLAYVIYTSGSTGAPKGVMVEHAQLAQQVDTHIAQCTLTRADRMLQFASISFDSAVVEIFPTLAAGATLVLRGNATTTPDAEFIAYLDRHRVTITDLPTAFWAQWAQQLAAGQSRLGVAQRLVVVGGEKVEQRHLQAWLSAAATQRCRWLNTYGPTEATVYAAAFAVAAGEACPAGEIPIGRPTGHGRIYLLDRCGQLLPPGAIGEICIGGAGVARGYLHRPQLSAERFAIDTFWGDVAARLYRTGDLGRWRADGQLEFHGRNDRQVKLRGFRIELGEVEAALAAHTDVAEAVVVVRGEGAAARLVAYVVMRARATTFDARELRAFLATRLVEHMLPAVYVALAALPLTPNGKIDHAALLAPDASAVPIRAHVPPRTPLERTLAELWQGLLEVAQVGAEDNFFELGGHSLLAIGLIESLRRLGIACDVRTLFSTANLAALAAALEPLVPGGQAPPNRIPPGATAITPDMLTMLELDQAAIDTVCADVAGGAANLQDVYPLGPLQQGMLFHHLLDGEGDAYLMRTVLAFDQRAQLDAFVQALQQVIDRHDALRTSIHWQHLAQPVQAVQRRAPLPVHEMTADAGEALAQLLAATDPRRIRLDLRQAPLMAVHAIADPANGRWMLALLEHHIVCDHITLELMLDEVGLILQGRHSELPTPWPYRHFIAQTSATPASVHESFFREQLADVVHPAVPFGVMGMPADGATCEEAIVPLDATLSQLVRTCARAEGITASALFHLAWALVVARSSGCEEAVFGTVLAGRSLGAAGADRALGLFLNTLPLRIPTMGGGVREALRDTHRRLADLLAHEQAPLALAQRCSGVAAALPLFNSMFNYRHSSIAAIDNTSGAGVPIRGCGTMRALRLDERTTYPLSVSIDDTGEVFVITAHAVAQIGAERVGQMLLQTVNALATAGDGATLDAVQTLPAKEAQHLDVLAGEDLKHEQLQMLAHQMFERQVRLAADATALVDGAQRLSYAEVEARACRRAQGLVGYGLKRGDLVALHLARGVDLVIAMLAVWKAGAAYVPLDPDYPDERLAYMLADSRARLLLFDADLGAALAQRVATIDGIVSVSLLELDARSAPTQVAATAAGLDDLAYVIYTSGSTGTPKGVMVSHRGIGNLVYAQAHAFGVGPGSGVLQFAPSSFDASVSEILLGVCTGARLHLPARAALIPGTPLVEVLAHPEITHATLPSSALAACGDQAAQSIAPGKLTLIVAGDVLPPALARQWSRRQTLFNAYGPTESTVCASIHLCRGDESGAVPIGRPLPNTRLRLLDRQCRAVPVGALGEIYIGGVGVARGYLHRPELSAERFVVDPYSDDPHARLYRTGDTGRWNAQGELEFHGRNDRQIKLRGFRVELGEIEAALAAHEQVREAVVVVQGESVSARLVAYVVAKEPDHHLDARDLRTRLAQRLADYMLPSAYVQMPALPLSPSGKVDRAALPPPAEEALVRGGHEPPVGEVEVALAGIWCELLRVPNVGRRDDFTELGGHSLLFMQLATRLRERFEVDVPLRELFEQSAFAAQANLIVDAQLRAYADVDVAALQGELGAMSEAELRALLMEEVSDES